MKIRNLINILAIIATTLVGATSHAANKKEILNASYDPTRELYDNYNKYFINYWKEKTGEEFKIKQSHGGSGKQARSVIDGLEADVVTLALAYDVDSIASRSKLISADWEKKFSHNSAPYNSTIVFLVRKGNPKNIKDWNDLVKPGTKIVTPNPKTSGGARWNYLAALAYANKQFGGDEEKSKAFLHDLFANVVIYDTGARGSTITFVQRGIGDVLIAWENEAFLSLREFGADKFEIVTPSISILAEPSVAVVEKVAIRHGTYDFAKAYLGQLYSKEGQEIIAKNFYRPTDPAIAKKYQNKFPKLSLTNVNSFGGWTKVQQKHFDDGGIFDQITKK